LLVVVSAVSHEEFSSQLGIEIKEFTAKGLEKHT
jgi:hypothetical protein